MKIKFPTQLALGLLVTSLLALNWGCGCPGQASKMARLSLDGIDKRMGTHQERLNQAYENSRAGVLAVEETQYRRDVQQILKEVQWLRERTLEANLSPQPTDEVATLLMREENRIERMIDQLSR